jgi:RNA recognition motif-containing protein
MGYGCRTGDSRGFAFVRYKYEDEAQKAVDRLDGEFCLRFSPLEISVLLVWFQIAWLLTCAEFYLQGDW